MIDYIDNKTRIKLKFYLPITEYCFCLQRKTWYGWKTIVWQFTCFKSSYKEHKDYNELKKSLLDDEKLKNRVIEWNNISYKQFGLNLWNNHIAKNRPNPNI